MQKINSKSKWLLVLTFSLFVSIYFISCKKEDVTDWKCDSFEVLASGPTGTEYLLTIKKITISFEMKNASITVEIPKVYDPLLLVTYYPDLKQHILADYSLTGENVIINIDENEGYASGQTWTGRINKKSMSLDGVFGKTIEFRK